MSKRKIYLASFFAMAFLFSGREACAQGWPVFDATKLTSLITSYAAKLQGFPTSLQNIQGMKDLQGVVAPQKLMEGLGGLGTLGKKSQQVIGAFNFGDTPVSKAGERGADAASAAAKAAFYAKEDDIAVEDLQELNAQREEATEVARKQELAMSVHMVANHDADVAEFMETVDKALENAAQSGGLVDQINANTLAIMANSIETKMQIELLMTNMDKRVIDILRSVPVGGYEKPKATVIDGKSIDKGEANVVLE